MSKGGKPPAAPDYIGAAREQGRQNLDAIRTGAALNRVNQSNPFGSTSYRNLGGDQWEQTTELSPDQQRILDQQEGNQIDLGRIAGMRLGQVGNQGEFHLNGLPAQRSSVNPSNFQGSVNAPSIAQRDVDLSDMGNLPTDFSSERRRAEDALYGSATRQLDPQFQQREETARTRLMNSGLREGSEAWNTEMANLDRDRQSAYGDARDRAIRAGGDEATRMLSDALRTRQQGVSERFGTGEFANRAAGQELQGDLSRAGFANDTEGQRFAQSLTNAQLGNEGRATGISERLMQRQLPMQEFLQMYGGGGQQQGANAAGIPNVGSPEPVDHMGAVNAQYGAQSDMYNWRQQRNAQNTQTGVSLAALAAMFAMSDRRAKTDIKRVGALPNGIPTYRYRYRGEERSRIGVMSDEVRQVMPDAVVTGEDGFDRVNYAAIGAAHLLGAD